MIMEALSELFFISNVQKGTVVALAQTKIAKCGTLNTKVFPQAF